MFTYTSSVDGIGNLPYPNAQNSGTAFTSNFEINTFSSGNTGEYTATNGNSFGQTDFYYNNSTTYLSDTAGGRTQKTEDYTYSSITNTNAGASNGFGPDYAYAGAVGNSTDIDGEINRISYLFSDGIYVSLFTSASSSIWATYSHSDSASIGTTTYGESNNGGYTSLTRYSSISQYFEYRGAETWYNNSYYYTSSYINNNNGTIDSGVFITSSEYITTIYNTYEFITTASTTTTQDDPFIPTLTTTYEYWTTGRVTYAHYGTSLDDELFNPLILSTSDTITFTYLSKTTEGTGSDSYLTITTYTSSANLITTYTSTNSYAKKIIYTSYTDYYSDFGYTLTGIITAGSNWAWGTAGAVLSINGVNESFINKFSDLSIVTENTLIDPNFEYDKYEITRETNNSSFTYEYTISTYTETTVYVFEYSNYDNTSYYFDSIEGSVKSTLISSLFYSTSQATALIPTTTLVSAECPVGSYTYVANESIMLQTAKTDTIILDSLSNATQTVEYFVNYIFTFTNALQRVACTSTYTSYFSQTINTDGGSTTYGGTTYGDNYASYEVQSFNTLTAKSYSHVGSQFNYGLKFLRKIHGKGQIANIIYLHTSASNKTDNTGYYIYSNNLSSNALPNILSYNATSILEDGQLQNYQGQADAEYYEYAGFARNLANLENPPALIATPISQSSYSWIVYSSAGSNTTRITASYGGVSDSGSYSIISGNESTSNSSSGIISHYFAQPAGTCLYLGAIIDSAPDYMLDTQALGGKQRLYSASDTIFPRNISTEFAYSDRDSILVSSAYHIYSQTDFNSTGTSLSSTFYSGSLSASSQVNSLKFIRLNNDSWVVVDADLSFGEHLGGVILESPETVFYQQNLLNNYLTNRGIWASFETYYGSTYLV
jgi:hypothetical protein